MPEYAYLIVGGGMTADAAVRGIRELDAQGSIGVVGAEPEPPYARPPLSKALWKGEPFDSIWKGTEATGAELHLGRRVVALDADAREVTDDRGTRYGYGQLLLATGGSPRRLPFGGDAVVYFRTVADYRRLRQAAGAGTRFAVVGGGFIGAEVAAALALQGCRVTMLFPDAGIGARVFPADLARYLVDYYREHGVDVRPGSSATGIVRQGAVSRVETGAGPALEVDGVVAGIGIVPATELAERAGIATDDGIVVDEHLETDRPGVYAAGDVARFPAPALGRRLRFEHEDNALATGRAAGRAMAGERVPFTHLPFFYSDLFELGYEAVGDTDARLETVADWREPFRAGVVYYLAEGRVRGVLLWNTWEQVDAARALIAAPGPFRAGDLAGRLPA